MPLGFFRRGGGSPKRRAPGARSPFQYSRRLESEIAEMLGVIREVLADGVVSEEEAQALAVWIEGHPEAVEAWPGKVLAHRLRRIFEDGRVDEAEREELARLLRALAAGDWGVRTSIHRREADIPFTEPPPLLVFPGTTFVFVGEFAYGSRTTCREVVERLGGRTEDHVRPGVDVVVVGTFGVADWRRTAEGGEIETALRLQSEGHRVQIMAEDYWVSCLPES